MENNKNNKIVVNSFDSAPPAIAWGCPETEVTGDSVTKIIDQAKQDGLFDDVLKFEPVQESFEDLCVMVGNYRGGNRLGVYFPAFNTILIHSDCPLEKVKGIVLHELIHMVCCQIDSMYDEDDLVQMEIDASRKVFFESLNNKLENCIPNFPAIQDLETINQWVTEHKDESVNSELFNCYYSGHSNWFWQMSVNVDYTLGWPIGTTSNYKMATIVQKIFESCD